MPNTPTAQPFLDELDRESGPLDEAERYEAEHALSAGDLEQMQQEDALFPWLADDSMADEMPFD